MRSIVLSRPRKAGRGVAAVVLLVALALGLGPVPAFALDDAIPPPATVEPAPLPVADDATAPPVAAGPAPALGEAVTVFSALASARQASLGLNFDDAPDVFNGRQFVMPEEYATVQRAVDHMLAYVKEGDIRLPEVEPGVYVDVEALKQQVEQLRAALEALLPSKGEVLALYDDVAAEVERLRVVAVDSANRLTALALIYVDGVVDLAPTPDELVALAEQLRAFVLKVADDTEVALLHQLDTFLGFVTDPARTQPVKDAVTTVLLTVANAVDPLPEGLAPTAETAVNAVGTLVSLADDLAQQAVESPPPGYDTTDTDSDEPAQSPTNVTVVDSDLFVGDEPVVVTGPGHTTGPVPAGASPTFDSSDDAATGDGFDCGMYEGQRCYPPMQTRGGRVIHHPKVRVVLAGSCWRGQPGYVGALDNLFSSMGGSGYQNILRQYYDENGYIGAAVTYEGTHVVDTTPPSYVTDADVARYAVRAARDHGGWATAPDVVWVVALPPDVTSIKDGKSDTKCGYQDVAASGGRRYVLAVLDFPRGDCLHIPNDPRGSLTRLAAHEYVGAVTNPDLDAWRDRLGNHLPDLCRALPIRGPGGEWVTKLWSNASSRCVSSFTPRFAYRVDGVTNPAGDTGPASAFTRGHVYPGGAVAVTNTGNMPWLSFGGKRTYLGTADNACSPLANRTKVTEWVSCRRIQLPQGSRVVGPGSSVTFGVSIQPDGSLHDDDRISATFRMVAGSTWMDDTGSRSAQLSGLDLQTFDALLAAPVTYVAAGQHGTDTKVTVSLRNTGTAWWYPREVMYLGTDTVSRFAATSWPTGPDGCRGCRAHRFDKLTPPGGIYTFDLTLHIPVERLVLASEKFFPFADVRRVSDGRIEPKKLLRGEVHMQVVAVPKPAGAHDVTAYGLTRADDPAVPGDDSGFTCAAVAGSDAVRTAITSCTATVTTAYGTTYTTAAAAVTADGRAAWTTIPRNGGYRPADGDTVRVCWSAEAVFLDGTKAATSGCT